MENPRLSISVLPQKIAICRLQGDAQIPSWVQGDSFFSFTKTSDECSLVCSEDRVPQEVQAEKIGERSKWKAHWIFP